MNLVNEVDSASGCIAPLIFEREKKKQTEQSEKELSEQTEEQALIEEKIRQRIETTQNKTPSPPIAT